MAVSLDVFFSKVKTSISFLVSNCLAIPHKPKEHFDGTLPMWRYVDVVTHSFISFPLDWLET